MGKGTLLISNLFFAYESLLFFKATVLEAESMRELLKTSKIASGLEINYGKSALLFITNTPMIDRGRVCNILQFHEASHLGKYLGVPICIRRKKLMAFSFIHDRVWHKLQNWNTKYLSRAGKSVLIKAVSKSIPNHYMSVYLLLVEMCHELEKMMNSFWWGRNKNQRKRIN